MTLPPAPAPSAAAQADAAPRPRRVAELTAAAAAAALRRDPRLLVPVGALDAHGPHLPLGTDALVIDRLADDLSARTGVLRAPTITYGVNAPAASPEAGVGAGSASLRKKTLHRLLNDLLNAWEDGGVKEFVLLTAHRNDPHLEALATVVTTAARVLVVDALAIDVADLLEGQEEAMHADEVDTSLVLHLAPDLVRADVARDNMIPRDALRRFQAGKRARRRRGEPAGTSAPVFGRPSFASAAKGQRIYERLVERIATRVLGAPALVSPTAEAVVPLTAGAGTLAATGG